MPKRTEVPWDSRLGSGVPVRLVTKADIRCSSGGSIFLAIRRSLRALATCIGLRDDPNGPEVSSVSLYFH